MKRIIGWVALASGMMASTGAQAASCWDQRAVEAAQIHEFDIMLMVAALRCQVKGTDFVPDYNRFVSGNRAALVGANDEIRAHLNAGMGGKAALDAYDHISTAMANRYGNGGGVYEDCAGMRGLIVNATPAGAADATRAFLVANAQRVGVDPELDGGRCPVVVVAENRAALPAFPATRMVTAEPMPVPAAAAPVEDY